MITETSVRPVFRNISGPDKGWNVGFLGSKSRGKTARSIAHRLGTPNSTGGLAPLCQFQPEGEWWMNPDRNHRNHGIKPEESVELASTGDKTAVIVDVGRKMPLRSLPRPFRKEYPCYVHTSTHSKPDTTYLFGEAEMSDEIWLDVDCFVVLICNNCQIIKNRKGRPLLHSTNGGPA